MESVALTPKSYLNNLLTAVKFQRERKNKVTLELSRVIQAIDETELGKQLAELKVTMAQINAELADLEVRARDAAVLVYQESGERKPLPGAEVKMYSTVKITDERAALKWAAENAPATLKLDTTKFNAAVRLLDLPFIELGEEPRGTIASNLPNQD